MQPWRVKICGVTCAEDALAVAAAGADAIGLNFYPQSRRYVEPGQAASILAAVPAGLWKVGVFVNATAEQIHGISQYLALDLVQLHGDEPPELLTELGTRPIVRAFRCGPAGLAPAAAYLQRCQTLGVLPEFILLDAFHPAQYGGTGRTLDWGSLQSEIARLGDVRWVLAGGLTPDNVADAIRRLRPAGVDTASGVERAGGRKDPQRMHEFVQAALAAWT
jgi:phosphoribosylanthranilate isomerase